jgi:hypothetical protein
MKEMSKLVKVSLCVCGFVVPGAIGTGVTIVTGIPGLTVLFGGIGFAMTLWWVRRHR